MGRTWVEWLGEEDLVKLQPLAFLELSVLLDQSGVRFPKRKPHKRKRKEGKGPCLHLCQLTLLLLSIQNYEVNGIFMEIKPQVTTFPDKISISFNMIYISDGPVVFGASLSSLLEKDQQITNDQHNVPLVFQKVRKILYSRFFNIIKAL